jgi:hypothetical protein
MEWITLALPFRTLATRGDVAPTPSLHSDKLVDLDWVLYAHGKFLPPAKLLMFI